MRTALHDSRRLFQLSSCSARSLVSEQDVVANHIRNDEAALFLGHVGEQPRCQESELDRQRLQPRMCAGL